MTYNEMIVQHSIWSWGDDYHIVTSDGQGFVRLCFDKEDNENIICDLYVSEGVRRRGVATRLLDKCDEILNGRKARVVPKEEWMRQWYIKRGYEIIV